MLAGSLVVQQVSQIAVLEYERAKLASLKLRATRLGELVILAHLTFIAGGLLVTLCQENFNS